MDISHCSVIGIGRISVGLLTCTCRWCQSEKKNCADLGVGVTSAAIQNP